MRHNLLTRLVQFIDQKKNSEKAQIVQINLSINSNTKTSPRYVLWFKDSNHIIYWPTKRDWKSRKDRSKVKVVESWNWTFQKYTLIWTMFAYLDICKIECIIYRLGFHNLQTRKKYEMVQTVQIELSMLTFNA